MSITRRELAILASAALTAPLLGRTAVARTASDAVAPPSGTNIVLVHGAWSDGSGWAKIIPILQGAGHNVLAVQNQMLGLQGDVANVRAILATLTGRTVLVGHSYGGAVITAAGYDAKDVSALVYVAAFAPDEGESLGAIGAKFSPPSGGRFIAPGASGLLYIQNAHMGEAFAADIPPSEAAVLAATQRPVAGAIFTDVMSAPAWKQHKSWYQVSEDDQMIAPDAERFMATRAKATTISLKSSHASLISHPREIAQLILNACEG